MNHLPEHLDWTYVVGAFLLSIPGYLTWFSSRTAAKVAAAKVEEVRHTLENTSSQLADKVETIHKVVNSERTAMIEKIEEMHATILSLTREAAEKT